MHILPNMSICETTPNPTDIHVEYNNSHTTPEMYGLQKVSSMLPLTPLDMAMPRLYGARWILCFQLPPGTNSAQVYENLRIGLAHTIKSIPWIAGNIAPEEGKDPKYNRIQVVDASEGVKFPFNDLTGVLPSYATLKKENFPLSRLSTAQLGPIDVFGGASQPVLAAQANFIENGLLLTVGVHHSVCDASGLDTIVDTWAINTAAATGSNTFTRHDTQSNDREPLMKGVPGAQITDFPEYILAPLSVDAPAPQIPQTFQMPLLVTHIFHFSPDSLANLKATAAAFSTHDALCAFIWRHMTLARSGPGASTTDDDTAFAFAVNIRGRTSPPLSPTYLGNASMVSMTNRLAKSTLLSDTNYSHGAAAIRKSVNAFKSPSRVPLIIGLFDSRQDPTNFKLAYNSFLGPDIVQSSWADIGIYQSDWGTLGKVDVFRTHGEGADGVVMIYPRLHDGGLEVTVALEHGAMERLLKDEQFNKIARLCG